MLEFSCGSLIEDLFSLAKETAKGSRVLFEEVKAIDTHSSSYPAIDEEKVQDSRASPHASAGEAVE